VFSATLKEYPAESAAYLSLSPTNLSRMDVRCRRVSPFRRSDVLTSANCLFLYLIPSCSEAVVWSDFEFWKTLCSETKFCSAHATSPLRRKRPSVGRKNTAEKTSRGGNFHGNLSAIPSGDDARLVPRATIAHTYFTYAMSRNSYGLLLVRNRQILSIDLRKGI
jgi:hypothetical protein